MGGRKSVSARMGVLTKGAVRNPKGSVTGHEGLAKKSHIFTFVFYIRKPKITSKIVKP